MAVAVRGLDSLEGQTAFAFCVLRLDAPRDRAGMIDVLRYLAPLIPDVETFIAGLPAELDEDVRVIGLPWAPPEAGHALIAQRRLAASAGGVGVEAAWFFQTGTSLPREEEVAAAGGETAADEVNDAGETLDVMSVAMADVGPEASTQPIEVVDLSADDDFGSPTSDDLITEALDIGQATLDDSLVTAPPTPEPELGVATLDEVQDDHPAQDDSEWSNGPPRQLASPRFPVDGYPTILDELDWQDFGIAIKLRGEATPGEGTVLLGFHTLWLAPYAERYRNAAVTFDRKHHAVHLWVDRFAVPCSPAEQVHHLLWIVSELDEIIPVLRARFAGATMAQKFGGLMGDESEPFVLGGNPLLAIYAAGGEAAVDSWIAEQSDWSNEEIAHMLRELAIEIVTADGAGFEDREGDQEDDDDREEYEEDDEDHDDDDDDDDDEAEGNQDEERGRHITTQVGELLASRASAGKLDSRVAEKLLAALGDAQPFEPRRRAIVEILGALRHRPAVPALVLVLQQALAASPVEDDIASAAAALGKIGDPAAIPMLASVVAAPGTQHDGPRSVAADALASCLAAAPEPHAIDDTVLRQLLVTIRERNDGELNAEAHFAYGRLARLLPPDRRLEARRKLADTDTARDDGIARLARQTALVLASPSPLGAPPHELQRLLHDALTSLGYEHHDTVRNLGIAMRVAEVVPTIVIAEDLIWLTRFAEGELRDRAHALLERLGKPLARAQVFDRFSVRSLDDDQLVQLIGEAHVVGRDVLIADARRRGLIRAKRAIIDACHDVIGRARQGSENLLEHDARVLHAALPMLRLPALDRDVVALFDRMLRHSNYHVKSQLLRAIPHDERLIGGMFHVLRERGGWQHAAAKRWLQQFAGTDAYETERKRAPASDDDDPVDDGLGDEDMN